MPTNEHIKNNKKGPFVKLNKELLQGPHCDAQVFRYSIPCVTFLTLFETMQ